MGINRFWASLKKFVDNVNTNVFRYFVVLTCWRLWSYHDSTCHQTSQEQNNPMYRRRWWGPKSDAAMCKLQMPSRRSRCDMAPGIPTLEDIMTWKLHKRQFMYQVQGGIDLQKLLDYSNRLPSQPLLVKIAIFLPMTNKIFWRWLWWWSSSYTQVFPTQTTSATKPVGFPVHLCTGPCSSGMGLRWGVSWTECAE